MYIYIYIYLYIYIIIEFCLTDTVPDKKTRNILFNKIKAFIYQVYNC
jgi:hypothetical protein